VCCATRLPAAATTCIADRHLHLHVQPRNHTTTNHTPTHTCSRTWRCRTHWARSQPLCLPTSCWSTY
jgi:hypothetical protein